MATRGLEEKLEDSNMDAVQSRREKRRYIEEEVGTLWDGIGVLCGGTLNVETQCKRAKTDASSCESLYAFVTLAL